MNPAATGSAQSLAISSTSAPHTMALSWGGRQEGRRPTRAVACDVLRGNIPPRHDPAPWQQGGLWSRYLAPSHVYADVGAPTRRAQGRPRNLMGIDGVKRLASSQVLAWAPHSRGGG